MALNCMKEAVGRGGLQQWEKCASSLPVGASAGWWLPGILPLRPSPTACIHTRPLDPTAFEMPGAARWMLPLQTAFCGRSVVCTDRFVNVRLRRGGTRGTMEPTSLAFVPLILSPLTSEPPPASEPQSREQPRASRPLRAGDEDLSTAAPSSPQHEAALESLRHAPRPRASPWRAIGLHSWRPPPPYGPGATVNRSWRPGQVVALAPNMTARVNAARP